MACELGLRVDLGWVGGDGSPRETSVYPKTCCCDRMGLPEAPG